ncbi:putative lipoprotein [Leptospira broomii serovar Hurstbridge str. 5399]|uniref:Lipoprotein n=1 Tax=Leptospira broomii serovar Hurstbridge str. 5399 TaxID=1049789 RepID=T0GIM3_9LEPT|nr:hypothetical protein [Leptospira broomii]EQA45243.1 putative lipoprotein [Leptospira broomii serovar Hurstbridge str. 5399]
MKKLSIVIILLILSGVACQSFQKKRTQELTEDFKNVLSDSKVLIRQLVPPKFEVVPVDSEVPFHYDYALKSAELEIEIRYKIISIPAYMKEFEEFRKNNPKAVLVPPKKTDYLNQFILNLQNLAGKSENIFSTKPFPEKAVKEEFGADWGSNSFLKLDLSYDKKYKFCSMTVLHKDNVADIYIMYLSNDKEKLIKFLSGTYLYYNLIYQ